MAAPNGGQVDPTQAADAANAASEASGAADPTALEAMMENPNQETIMDVVFAYGPAVIKAVILILAAWLIAGWAKAIITRACNKAKIELTLSRFFGQMARWAILLLAGLTILSTFGIETTSFAAVLGGLMVGVGLAMSGNLANVAAGVMLLIFRPFKVGDFVTAGGSSGTVFDIGLFTTSMDTPDNKRIIVPNGSIYGGTIENVSFHPIRRCDVEVGTEYSADLDKVREVLKGAADSIEQLVPEKETQIFLKGLGASSIDWAVRVWVPAGDFWPVKDELTRRVKKSLDEAGIGIPFPQMDVHLDKLND